MTANPLVGGAPLGAALLGVHAAAVWFCAGLVWVIELLVYPGFAATAGPTGPRCTPGTRVAWDVW